MNAYDTETGTAPPKGTAPPLGEVAVNAGRNVDIDAVRRAIQAYIHDTGVSQTQVAKEAGIGVSTMSQFLAGEYAGRNDRVANDLFRWLNRRRTGDQARAMMPVVPTWVETRTAQRIWSALSYSHVHADIGVIYGGAGLGKTSTIREYARVNPRVYVVTVTPATSSVGLLLEAIAIAVGLRDVPLHPARLERAIVRVFTGTGALLVLDEAQHLTKQALEAARSVHDVAEIGLVLSGNAAVYNRLYGGGANGFAQLFSRVGRRLALVRPLEGDVRKIGEIYGIRDEATFAVLEDIGRKPGALRMVVKVCRLATALSPDRLDRSAIEAAFEELQAEAVNGPHQEGL